MGTGRYLLPSGLDDTSCHGCLKRTRRYCAISGPSWESSKFTDCLGSLVQCPQLAFPPFPSASWIGLLLVNCLLSDPGLSTKPHFLGLAHWSNTLKRVFFSLLDEPCFLLPEYIIISLCRAFLHVTSQVLDSRSQKFRIVSHFPVHLPKTVQVLKL